MCEKCTEFDFKVARYRKMMDAKAALHPEPEKKYRPQLRRTLCRLVNFRAKLNFAQERPQRGGELGPAWSRRTCVCWDTQRTNPDLRKLFPAATLGFKIGHCRLFRPIPVIRYWSVLSQRGLILIFAVACFRKSTLLR
jgi:hypothetical protein